MKVTKTSKKSQPVKAGSKYDRALSSIHASIDELGKIAKDDARAKDAIANLSVILLDLSSK